MAAKKTLTILGHAINVACVMVGLVVALTIMRALGYDGVLPAAGFGAVGGGVGGCAGYLIAAAMGQLRSDQR